MTSVLVWVPSETDPELRIPAGVRYFLGGSPRKHDGKEKERDRQQSGPYQAITTVGDELNLTGELLESVQN